MRRKLLLGLVIALWGLAASSALQAQVTTTTLFGRVTDSTGGPLVGANVKATNNETNLTRTTQAGPDGEYRIELLPVGIIPWKSAPPASKNSCAPPSCWK